MGPRRRLARACGRIACGRGLTVSAYGEKFFGHVRDTARLSAEAIVPIVLDLVHPKSVVDVGCGPGTWLAEFARRGVREYLGIDGFANPAMLEFDPRRFLQRDLTRPLELTRPFDLVVCLEVAEHLPPEHARDFVEAL